MNTFIKAAVATCFLVAASQAQALTFDFGKLHAPNVAGDFLPSSTYFSCTGSDICSSDYNHGIFGGSLAYTVGGVTATATGFYKGNQVTVVQDSENGYNPAKHISAGLGVYHKANDSSDDNITSFESLTITFSEAVHLTGISLRSDGHNITNWASNSTFLFNGTSTKLAGDIAFDEVGTTFTFAYGGTKPDQFYLSGMTIETLPVPEPSSVALMLAGLGLVAARRKAA